MSGKALLVSHTLTSSCVQMHTQQMSAEGANQTPASEPQDATSKGELWLAAGRFAHICAFREDRFAWGFSLDVRCWFSFRSRQQVNMQTREIYMFERWTDSSLLRIPVCADGGRRSVWSRDSRWRRRVSAGRCSGYQSGEVSKARAFEHQFCSFWMNCQLRQRETDEHHRGVTVHKIHGSVQYDTVVSVCFRYGGAGQLVTSQCLKYFCFKPWRRANGYQTSTSLHQGLHTCKIYAGERLNRSQFTINRKWK